MNRRCIFGSVAVVLTLLSLGSAVATAEEAPQSDEVVSEEVILPEAPTSRTRRALERVEAYESFARKILDQNEETFDQLKPESSAATSNLEALRKLRSEGDGTVKEMRAALPAWEKKVADLHRDLKAIIERSTSEHGATKNIIAELEKRRNKVMNDADEFSDELDRILAEAKKPHGEDELGPKILRFKRHLFWDLFRDIARPGPKDGNINFGDLVPKGSLPGGSIPSLPKPPKLPKGPF